MAIYPQTGGSPDPGPFDILKRGQTDYHWKLLDNKGKHKVNNWEFGLTMIIVGMGGTLVVLALFAVIMSLLKKIFPVKEDHPA